MPGGILEEQESRVPGFSVGFCLSALGVVGSSIWIVLFLRTFLGSGSVPFLSDMTAEPPPDGWPSLRMIFAARDEAEHVAQATRSMGALDYPGLAITAVDDRSVDGTGKILDDLARSMRNLSVIHVQELPEGWLGKCHALQTGAEASATSTEWLLFTDADVVFAPDTLKRAIHHASSTKVDHLTCTPDVPTEFLGERLFLTLFYLVFAINSPPGNIVNRRKKAATGVGAFNLVRAEAFHAIGGFRNIRLSVDDDLRLAQALKFAGYKPVLLHGKGCVTVRWHVGMRGMIRGMEKNFFAALDFRLAHVLLIVVGLPIATVMPTVGLFVGPWWARLICAAGVAAPAAVISLGRGQNRVQWYHALFLPFTGPVLLFTLLRSTYLTLRRGGVRWRDHLYPLEMLKEHVWLRNNWLRELWLSTR
jgi:glycosyltransferase involved in cell wall biosynthesis